MVDHISGRILKETTQSTAQRFFDFHLIEGLDHLAHPRIPLLRPDLEALVRLAQAQEPAELRVGTRTTQELREESGKRFDSASERLARKERAEHRIPRHP